MDGTEGWATETRSLTAPDGTSLMADLAVPGAPRAGAVLCHPHPDYGGDRHNTVVSALFEALPAAGITALRFDFRRPGGPSALEQAALDVGTALDAVDPPRILIGYSFGAAAALVAASSRADIERLVLVAPPLGMLPDPPVPAMPTLVLVPAHDQFSPPDQVEPVVASWPAAELITVEMADHFLNGRTTALAEAVLGWLAGPLAAG